MLTTARAHLISFALHCIIGDRLFLAWWYVFVALQWGKRPRCILAVWPTRYFFWFSQVASPGWVNKNPGAKKNAKMSHVSVGHWILFGTAGFAVFQCQVAWCVMETSRQLIWSNDLNWEQRPNDILNHSVMPKNIQKQLNLQKGEGYEGYSENVSAQFEMDTSNPELFPLLRAAIVQSLVVFGWTMRFVRDSLEVLHHHEPCGGLLHQCERSGRSGL